MFLKEKGSEKISETKEDRNIIFMCCRYTENNIFYLHILRNRNVNKSGRGIWTILRTQKLNELQMRSCNINKVFYY